MSNSSFTHIFFVKFFMFVQALKEEKEEGEDAQQVFKITYVTFVMFKLKMFWFGANLDIPKSRLEGRRWWLLRSLSTSQSSSTSRTILQ